MMSESCRITLFAGLLWLVAGSASAQLFIDVAGPRNVLVSSKHETVASAGKFISKVDSEKKSLSVGYLNSRDLAERPATLTIGFIGSSASPDGVEEVFKTGVFDASVIGNLTWAKSAEKDKAETAGTGGPFFVNLSGGMRHESLRVRAASAAPVLAARSTTGRATLSFGHQFNRGRNGIVLGMRYERTSNYEQLPKVDADGRPAREGVLRHSDAVPISLVVTHELPAGPLGDLLSGWFKQEGIYSLVGAIYAECDPSVAAGLPDHKVGLNLTVKRFVVPTGEALARRRAEKLKQLKADREDTPDDVVANMSPLSFADLTFPLSVFAEWQQPFGIRPAKFVTGVAVLYTWP